MSEKRQRQQQRRASKAAGSRPARRSASSDRAERDEMLVEMLSEVAEIVAGAADEPTDALDAEVLASSLVGTLPRGPLLDMDSELLGRALVAALEKLGNAGALAALRAVGALEGQACAAPARAAADRLAGAGLPEPRWANGLGQARPLAAELMSEPAFDDGVSVMIEFAAPGGWSHTLGVYIDHNAGGVVKDAFVAGPLSQVRETLAAAGDDEDDVTFRELELGEARARVERALDILDHTLYPPVDEDARSLRAFVEARARLLPTGVTLPDEYVEVTAEERDRLVSDFLGSAEGRRWRDDAVGQDIAALAIDFGADYNHGGPLRWSPVVVEIFMASWLARKVSREREFFERVPDVLRDWVRYAARRRGVPAAARREAIDAVERHRDDLLESVDDPEAWGPAKMFAMAAMGAGVDLSDPDAVGAFVERYNDGLAA